MKKVVVKEVVDVPRMKNRPRQRRQRRRVPAAQGLTASTVLNQPVSVGVVTNSSQPMFNGSAVQRVRHREYCYTIGNGTATGWFVSPINSAVPGLDIGPGDSVLTPWLNPIARRFERYVFHSLKVEFIPGQATTTAGRYYAAIEYDYNDDPATEKVTFMNNQTVCQANVWSPMVLVAKPESMHPRGDPKFTSPNGNEDGRLTYGGYLMCAFEATTPVTFDIYVTYDVSFFTPQMEVPSVLQTYPSAYHAWDVVPDTGPATLARRMLPVGPALVEGLRSFVNGSLGNLLIPGWNTGHNTEDVLDVRRANGTIVHKCDVSAGGVLGSAWIGSLPAMNCYSSNGLPLADVNADPAFSRTVSVSAVNVDVPGVLQTVIPMARLRALLPNIAYIVMSIVGNTAGGNTARQGLFGQIL